MTAAFAVAVCLVSGGEARAQDESAAPAPTLAEAVQAANDQLAANPSPWRPCQGAAQVTLDDKGYLEITTERSGYCADSRQRLHIADLDAALVSVEVDVEGAVVVGCKAGKDCVRHFRRRKVRADDGGWERKDDRWVPDGPATMPHLAAEARIELFSDERVAKQVAAALAFVARTAEQNQDQFEPADPFAGRVATLGGGGRE
ncbi:MAG: hypothetical protein VX000_01155 [Myxococcota bacterium]|nr:hypothetical protein [Myxococcota bacterium]